MAFIVSPKWKKARWVIYLFWPCWVNAECNCYQQLLPASHVIINGHEPRLRSQSDYSSHVNSRPTISRLWQQDFTSTIQIPEQTALTLISQHCTLAARRRKCCTWWIENKGYIHAYYNLRIFWHKIRTSQTPNNDPWGEMIQCNTFLSSPIVDYQRRPVYYVIVNIL